MGGVGGRRVGLAEKCGLQVRGAGHGSRQKSHVSEFTSIF